ncbi:MAG: hypothetical protein Q4D40_04280 [Eubacteriales bacterium]|nr:hypothetical protein [Eubacteriales bacterium]
MNRSRIRRIAGNGIMGALLVVLQVGLSSIPNTELVTPVLICYAIVFGSEAYAASLVFAFLEILVWGLGLWNIMYIYIWPLLVLLTLGLKAIIPENLIDRTTGQLLFGLLAGVYGLCFGALCTIVYIVVSPATAFAWWVAGIKTDIWHGFCNLTLTIIVYRPVINIMRRVKLRERS